MGERSGKRHLHRYRTLRFRDHVANEPYGDHGWPKRTDTDADTIGNSDSYSHAYSHAYTHANTHAYTHAYTHANTDRNLDFAGDAGRHLDEGFNLEWRLLPQPASEEHVIGGRCDLEDFIHASCR